MLGELEKLEERIAEAAKAVQVLREQNQDLAGRVGLLEEDRKRLLEERAALADRISRLVDKVDALRTEI
jgi:predicted nuclease with TOPRIM domain